jgi:uncharacterized membrane protein
MTLRLTAFDGLSLGMIGLSTALGAALRPLLPPRIATHFDVHGVADGFMEPGAAIATLSGLTLGTWLVVRFAPRLLSAPVRARLDASPLHVVAFLVAALLVGLEVLVLSVAVHGPWNISAAVGMGLGAFFVAISMALPRVRRNPLLGIRTPWTLASDENWARTHRIGSYTFLAGGIAAILFAVAGFGVAAYGALLLGGLAPAVYSYRIAH